MIKNKLKRSKKEKKEYEEKLILFLVLALVLTAFSACGGKDDGDVGGSGNDVDIEENGDDIDVSENGNVKTGMAVLSHINFSQDAGDRDGVAQGDSTVVVVTVDDNGVITNCMIDHAMTTTNFSEDGKFLTPLDTVYKGKQDLGDDYDMRKASPIGREWNEQADDLAAYVIGKTVADLKAWELDETGAPTDADLSSAVTVTITGYLATIEKAVNNATHMGASADDKVGIGLVTTVADSKDAGDENGLAQPYSYYAGVTFDSSGVITSAIIDASIIDIEFSNDGKLVTGKDVVFKTKNELGSDYGMIAASTIDKEWNEQAAAFADYVTGKTVSDVKGTALTDGGGAADSDLASSVTIGITSFIDVVEKASNSAR